MSSLRRESSTTPPSPPKRHAMRASKPLTPLLDLPPSRRRAQSEVVRKDLTSGKWRIVGAWSSLRHSLNTTRREESENELHRHQNSRISSMRRDSTLGGEAPLSAPPIEGRPRKRVSLFVRRRRKGSEEMVLEAGEPWTDEDEEGVFRRVQSSLVKPVADEQGEGGEGGRYVRYAEQVGDEVWEKEEEIIGEICLEDFADGEGEDVEWLENVSVDLSVLEPTSGGRRMSRRPSLKLEGGVRWVGNETEFAKFFAEVGLDEFLDVEEVRLEEFEVDADVVAEWERMGAEHNSWCETWADAHRRACDIRDLVHAFCARRR